MTANYNTYRDQNGGATRVQNTRNEMIMSVSKKKRKKPNFSKMLCVSCVGIFILTLVAATYCSLKGYPTDIFIYAIPATAGLAIAGVCFYFNKAKTENLSKQRIRYVLMKLLLNRMLSPEAYEQICYEIDNIDSIIDNKLNDSLNEAVSEDISAINHQGGY